MISRRGLLGGSSIVLFGSGFDCGPRDYSADVASLDGWVSKLCETVQCSRGGVWRTTIDEDFILIRRDHSLDARALNTRIA